MEAVGFTYLTTSPPFDSDTTMSKLWFMMDGKKRAGWPSLTTDTLASMSFSAMLSTAILLGAHASTSQLTTAPKLPTLSPLTTACLINSTMVVVFPVPYCKLLKVDGLPGGP